ncbi:type II secretion system protein N [Luteimonas aestuarii]|uniref:type II secretion system protein N n=1 Tax=Luteimonas aestuarii TaxID=453837 RepID=UPI001404DA51|nr:type II secretion system protein N [Luteimonas aestuarii]
MTTLSQNSPRLLTAIQFCLLAVLAAQGVRLSWGLLAPVAPAPVVLDPLPTGDARPTAARPDPFHPEGGGASATAPQGDWTLHGVRRTPDGSGSTAILSQAGGTQVAHRVGDEIAPGMVLETVGGDHVLLRRDTQTVRVDLPVDGGSARRDGAAGSLPTSPPPVAPAATDSTTTATQVDAAALFAAARLRAYREDGRVTGYTLMPGNDDALLRQVGLQPGDVLLDVNGQALDPERLLQLSGELQSADGARLTFRRDGQTRTLQLGARAP